MEEPAKTDWKKECERLRTELAKCNIRRAKAETKVVDLQIQIEAMREELDRVGPW